MSATPAPAAQRGARGISLLGFTISAAGVALDVLVHLAFTSGHTGFTPSQHGAHLVVLIGMVLTLAGVVIDGARSQLKRAPEERQHERTATHAAR